MLVCLQILRWGPLRNILLRYDTRLTLRDPQALMPTQYVTYFGNVNVLIAELEMSNRLSCYVFVVDSDGRVRWRSSGVMLEAETQEFQEAIGRLLT